MTDYFTSAWRRAALVLTGLLLSGAAALAQNIGIGTNAPTQALDVNGNLRVRGLSNPGRNGRLLSVKPDGTLTAGDSLGALSGLGVNAQFLPTPAVASIPLSNGGGYSDMATDGRYLYLLGSGEVRVYDPVTPAQPTPVGAPAALRPNAGGIRITAGNGYAYVVNNTNALDVYQLTAPNTFVWQRTVSTLVTGATSAAVYDLVQVGNYLYYVGDFSGLGVNSLAKLVTYDLTDPANPVQMNALDVPNSTRDIVLLAANERTGTLYASVNNQNITQYKFAAPRQPTAQIAVGTTTQRELQKTGIVGGVYYQIYTDEQLIYVFDVNGNSASPPLLGTIVPPARVGDLVFVGRYAYFLGRSASGPYILAAQVAAPSVLTFDTNGGISTQSAVLPTNNDNLGNHTASQNLNLAGFQLVSNGGSGLSISSSGQVGIGTTAPAAALDVNGATRATNLTATGAAQAATVVASTNVQTPAVLTPATGSHNMLVQAYGSIGSAGTYFGSTDNFTVTHTPGTNTYRINFTNASGLSTTVLSAAAVNLTLYGAGAGFITYTTTTPGVIDVTTTNASGQAAERGFSFSVYLP